MRKELKSLLKTGRLTEDNLQLLDLHVHSKYCDGNGEPEEIVSEAIRCGIRVIGFSGHCHTDFDEEACMSIEATDLYEKAVRDTATKHSGQIRVLCGIEQDYFGAEGTGRGEPAEDRWDYVIGSVHYVECEKDGRTTHPSVDDTPEIFEKAVIECYGGDVYAFAEDYYSLLGDIAVKTGADIIGHFDLFAKFNSGGENAGTGKYFNEGHPRYIAAWRKAADRLLETDVLFEINFGAFNKGYRKDPYPSKPIRDYLKTKGARFVLSSDSHSPDTLCKGFSDFRR